MVQNKREKKGGGLLYGLQGNFGGSAQKEIRDFLV